MGISRGNQDREFGLIKLLNPRQKDSTSQGLGEKWDTAGAPFPLKIPIIPLRVWLMGGISVSQEGTGEMH